MVWMDFMQGKIRVRFGDTLLAELMSISRCVSGNPPTTFVAAVKMMQTDNDCGEDSDIAKEA
jgi:hypothetical protein